MLGGANKASQHQARQVSSFVLVANPRAADWLALCTPLVQHKRMQLSQHSIGKKQQIKCCQICSWSGEQFRLSSTESSLASAAPIAFPGLWRAVKLERLLPLCGEEGELIRRAHRVHLFLHASGELHAYYFVGLLVI
jgi:hypothetical protein